MKTLQEQIIQKQNEIIEQLMSSHIDWMEVDLLQNELSTLKAHAEKEKVTDEDIDLFMCEVSFSEFDSYWDAMKYGAKAMRDGLIKPTEK